MKFIKKINRVNIWDKKSLLILSIIIFLLVGTILFISVDFKEFFIRNSSNWTATVGRIDSIEELTGINQTRMGNKIAVTGYKIEYTYLIGDDELHAETIISPLKNEFIAYAIEVKKKWEIEIYYKKTKITDSYVNTNLGSTFYKKNRTNK